MRCEEEPRGPFLVEFYSITNTDMFHPNPNPNPMSPLSPDATGNIPGFVDPINASRWGWMTFDWSDANAVYGALPSLAANPP
jgi:hypothetical protein